MEKLSMEVRLLIAMLLLLAVFGVERYFSPPPVPTEPTKQEIAKATAPPPSADNAPVTPEAGPIPGQIQAEQLVDFTIETNVHKVVFSNRGATVRNWVLVDYKDGAGKPLELVNPAALQLVGDKAPPPPFALAFRNPPAAGSLNDKLYKVTRSDDGLGVTFEWSDGRAISKKTFQFTKDSYLVRVTSQVTENGILLPHSLLWRGGFGDFTSSNPAAETGTLYFDSSNSSLNKKTSSDAEDAPLSVNGTFGFAGIEDRYFAAVVLPGAGSLELTTYSDNVSKDPEKEELRVGAGMGGSGALDFQLYVGPKDADFLKTVDPRLTQLIDWGWFRFIAQPMFVVLHWMVDKITHNWGWAIVLLTVVINMVLFPLRLSSMKSAKKMQAIQPEIARLNEKYKGAALNDTRKNEEMMAIYKKNGINPVGGCFPMLLQIPFFIALYKVLSITIELRGAPWMWVSDLSQPEFIAIRILPVVLVATQFLSQKMTPSPGMDPTQQKVMLFMPLMMGFLFWNASAGLVLYWLTSNVVSIAQQWLLNRNTPAPAVAVVVPPKKKK